MKIRNTVVDYGREAAETKVEKTLRSEHLDIGYLKAIE
jgi:hypothetical protein